MFPLASRKAEWYVGSSLSVMNSADSDRPLLIQIVSQLESPDAENVSQEQSQPDILTTSRPHCPDCTQRYLRFEDLVQVMHYLPIKLAVLSGIDTGAI